MVVIRSASTSKLIPSSFPEQVVKRETKTKHPATLLIVDCGKRISEEVGLAKKSTLPPKKRYRQLRVAPQHYAAALLSQKGVVSTSPKKDRPSDLAMLEKVFSPIEPETRAPRCSDLTETKLANILSVTEAVARSVLELQERTQRVIDSNPLLKKAPLQQRDCIKGVKTYLSEEGNVEVDVAGAVLGNGAKKKIKDITRIANGMIQHLIRFAAPTKNDLAQEEFRLDICAELRWREIVGKVPGLLDVTTRTYQPIDRLTRKPRVDETGKPIFKVRHFMKKCDSDLLDAMSARGEGLVKLNSEDFCQVVKWIRDAVTGLKSLHKKHVVHFDIKPENVLCRGEDGFLTDLGFAQRVGTMLFGIRGTSGFIAPEVIDHLIRGEPVEADPVHDMWGVGMLLLNVVEPSFVDTFFDIQEKMRAANVNVRALQRDFLCQLNKARIHVKNRGPYGALIYELLSLSHRPTAEDVEKRLYELPQDVQRWYPESA